MNQQRLRGVLRGIAIVIAVAALVDPVLSIERAPAVPLTLIKMTAADVAPIERELRRFADVHVREVVHHRLPCGPGDRCVMIADGSVDAEVPADLDRLSVIRAGNTAGANVRLQSVTIAAGQHASAAGMARVVVDGRGVIGRRSEIRVFDAAALVGSGGVDWTSDGVQTVDVPWWPLASGPRTLRVEAIPVSGESALFDNALTAGVDVGTSRLPVLVFDARASWAGTFVRRALEDDVRFRVEHRARLAPAIAAGTANGRLDARALDATSVLIVGGPDALTAGDVALIEQFVRVRGGTVVLLPERAPSGNVARLFTGEWSERLTSEPQDVGPLRASEMLVYPPKGGRYKDVYSAEGGHHQDGLVIAPMGSGRLVISTAMDAWRYRDHDAGAFDRFWRSVVAEGAAAGAPLRVEFEDAIGVPGSRQAFSVRYRSMAPVSVIAATAIARCGPPSQPSAASSPQAASADRAQIVRLWPAGSPGVLRGALPIAWDESCTVEVTVNESRVTRGIAVSNALSRSADDTLAHLERQTRATGGVVTDEDNFVPVAQDTPRAPVTLPVRPMHSVLWLLPFAGCLSAEWWLRRRTGLR